jgi:uncharacterized protein YndB with AHSA1/START domain
MEQDLHGSRCGRRRGYRWNMNDSTDPALFPTSVGAVRAATGRDYEEWFERLDGWGAPNRDHTDIAAWLSAQPSVGGWWAQAITVAYERARGTRAPHQTHGGFQVSVSRTVAVEAARLLEAFTDEPLRSQWLPDAQMTLRRTTAVHTARFDWADPPSRVAVYVTPKAADKASVTVVHEKLADAEAAERLKHHWRERLDVLTSLLQPTSGTG